MKVTLREVADEAGVSPATASRVLRGVHTGSDEIRRRVTEAARQTGYRPNPSSRSMRTGRSGTIAVVVDDLKDAAATDLFEAILRSSVNNGLSATPWSFDHFASTQDLLTAMGQHLIDGVVWMSSWTVVDAPEDVPLVVVGANHPAANERDIIRIDEMADMSVAARLLADLNRRHIAIAGAVESSPERLDALRVGLRTFDLNLDRHHVVNVPDSIDGGRQAARQLVDQGGCDGALALSAPVGIGLLDGLRSNGYSDQHTSVIIHARCDVAALAPYRATTLEPDTSGMAEQVVHRILARIAEPAAPGSDDVFPSTVVHRGSGPIAATVLQERVG